MKTLHIIVLVLIGLATAIIVSTADNAGEYMSFGELEALNQKGGNAEAHVIGELKKNDAGEIVGIEYDAFKDPNYLGFILVDERGIERKVISNNPPASLKDFEKSEKLVVVGVMKENHFFAKQILMKCPSKYQETKVEASAGS